MTSHQHAYQMLSTQGIFYQDLIVYLLAQCDQGDIEDALSLSMHDSFDALRKHVTMFPTFSSDSSCFMACRSWSDCWWHMWILPPRPSWLQGNASQSSSQLLLGFQRSITAYCAVQQCQLPVGLSTLEARLHAEQLHPMSYVSPCSCFRSVTALQSSAFVNDADSGTTGNFAQNDPQVDR